MSTGYLTLFRLRGLPVRMHWTLPLVAVCMGWLVSGDLLPVLPALQWLALVSAHVAGHVMVAQAHGGRPVELRLHSLGGRALTTGRLSSRARTSLAWGGLLGQVGMMGLLLVPVLLDRSVLDEPSVSQALRLNGLLMAINLLPFGELDGRLGWPLLARALQGPPADAKDPLEVPGLDQRIDRAARRLRTAAPPPAPSAPRQETLPPEQMPPEIVAAADALMVELRAERQAAKQSEVASENRPAERPPEHGQPPEGS